MTTSISPVTLRRWATRAAALSLSAMLALAAAPVWAQALLNPTTLTKYIDAVPNPFDNVIGPAGTLNGLPLYEVGITQFQQQLHSELAPTTLWGYNGMYPGPTFDMHRGEAIRVRWTNNLVDGAGQPLDHFLPYDNTLHGTSPTGGGGHAGHGGAAPFPQARTVVHLHGGVVDEMSDGYPEHWFTPDPHAAPNGMGGPAGNSMVTTYPNDQRASTMWYHDHAMAITRLNVYAGMAGFYINRDDAELALNLPSGAYEVPLLVQDKSFYSDGQLYYPGDPAGEGGHVQSFLGDVNVVNGKVWPYMEVEPRKYRLRLLNGANTRQYDLSIVPDAGAASADPLVLHQIGVDGGLLPATVARGSVGLAAADRVDLIVDFSQFAVGDTLRMLNAGPNASGETDEVMQFRVVPLAGPDASSLPATLVPVPRYDPADAVRVRQLNLTRVFDELGREKMLLDGKAWDDAISEILTLGELEIWEIANRTLIDHPIHLHMEAFQLESRRGLLGDIPLRDDELGWEDTVLIPAQQTARFMVKYDKFAGTFVWHCHLLEHEDHEMMRPFQIVVPEPAGARLAAIALVAAFWRRRSTRG